MIKAFVETRTLESNKLTPLLQNLDQPINKDRIRLLVKMDKARIRLLDKYLKQDLELCSKLSQFTIELDQSLIK